MKKISIVFFTLLCILNLYAQDTITLKNRKVIHAFIIEKSNKEIKYKLDSLSTYTVFIKELSKIRSIQYSSGDIVPNNFQHSWPKYPLGINLAFGRFGTNTLIAGNIDYFITPNFSIELDAGTNMGLFYSFGGKYWFANKFHTNHYSPYVGLFYGDMVYEAYYKDFLEFPVGISHVSTSGFQTTLQLSYVKNIFNPGQYLKVECKIGWRIRL